jgi:ferredoxin
MTQPEKDLIEAQRILDGSKCTQCGECGPEIGWDGSLWIACGCGAGVVGVDFDTNEVLKLWTSKNR